MSREEVGVITVDSGLCWLGDPCYVLHAGKNPDAIGSNWHEFCDNIKDDVENSGVVPFLHDAGHCGLGVAVETGFGDGVYPVFVERDDDGHIVRVTIEFIDTRDEDDEDDEDFVKQ